ncbi:hypothetical protein HPB51_011519 [Rhipicephalus microplus]|uniref:KRAB-related domain-containing protein n=1 Tax=Rhipicephalus microplus TaxID=6941 RepID=A0A9J6E8U1_RHIMP|nr:hypothetical protein HPB51_011519 [Rhipicephalus microplus]
MSSSDAEGVRRYFTEQEWLKLPDYMKLRYGNIKENYDKMVALGLQPPIPEFMNAKPAARNCPAKSKSCARANPTSVSRYPKRKLKNIKYTESEDPSDDENACSDGFSGSLEFAFQVTTGVIMMTQADALSTDRLFMRLG